MSKAKKTKNSKIIFSKRTSRILILLMWLVAFTPIFAILFLRYGRIDNDSLPSVSMLEQQEEMLATTILADDGISEIGKYWRVNRSSVNYNEISPYVISALIATEDERFEEHSGIDGRALGRAIVKMGKGGGASTISQQLAKLIFTLKEREERRALATEGGEMTEEDARMRKMNPIERRLYEKIKENIIALRLERRYTKNEIITMYLNQFDFLYNAVGIASASKVYFNKKAADLNHEEAAILVGMCKNPGLYNPHRFNVIDYRRILAERNNVPEDSIKSEQINEAREKDSLRAINRRNVVLEQWYKNSKKENPALLSTITKEELDSLKSLPIITDYQRVDFKEGVAPYFRESLRQEITDILAEKDTNGEYKYRKPNGDPYNIYEDGLKIYTSLNLDMQKHAEAAVVKHLKKNIQEPFDKNNRSSKKFPFASSIPDATVELLMNSSRKRSDRYRNMKRANYSEKEILASFDKPTQMKIFSWDGDIDTIMTPNDSIRYYKNIMQAGLVSIEPQTGLIKAWVGGPNINHFSYDHVAKAKRQVGSTIKPFIYSAGMQFGVITPCQTTPNISYCVDIPTGSGPEDMKQWCPRNAGIDMEGEPVTFSEGLSKSMNNITVAVMARMGGVAGPNAVAKLLESMNIHLRQEDIVPAMCLGVMDLSLLEITAAQATFINKGVYNSPSAIIQIEDRHGNVIYTHEQESREVLSEDLAYSTLKMMEQVVLSGTGASLRGTWRDWGGITHPTAGKTGTTQNNSDGWFMALTPDLVTGVWGGAEDMAVRFRSMTWGQGARLALPIYGYYMQEVYKDPKIHISTKGFEVPYGYENSIFNCANNQNSNTDAETTVPEFDF
ncbi:MAG: transglycosylase domain-containing protein [Brumimicrobium sp.]